MLTYRNNQYSQYNNDKLPRRRVYQDGMASAKTLTRLSTDRVRLWLGLKISSHRVHCGAVPCGAAQRRYISRSNAAGETSWPLFNRGWAARQRVPIDIMCLYL